MLPIKLDIERIDRELAGLLANLEAQLRLFENVDRPAYEAWLRVELGPSFSALDELAEKIHARRILAHRVNSLVQNEGLPPREALFVAMASPEEDPEDREFQDDESESGEAAAARKGFDPDEIEARRRAKLESKRARRKQEKREKSRESQASELKSDNAPPNRLVTLYRGLARKLHPDSPHVSKDLTSSQQLALWHEVQAAYDSSNLDRLLSIAAWLGTKVERPGEILGISERMERIRAMKKSIHRLELALAQLFHHSAWAFQSKIGNERKKLRKKAARELEDEIARTQEVLDLLDDFIDSIGPPKAPKAGSKTAKLKKRRTR